jgi:hypothetical protein
VEPLIPIQRVSFDSAWVCSCIWPTYSDIANSWQKFFFNPRIISSFLFALLIQKGLQPSCQWSCAPNDFLVQQEVAAYLLPGFATSLSMHQLYHSMSLSILFFSQSHCPYSSFLSYLRKVTLSTNHNLDNSTVQQPSPRCMCVWAHTCAIPD